MMPFFRLALSIVARCLVVRCLVAFFVAVPALAETVVLQSGDHPTFTRIALPMASPAQWRFGRIEGGYGLDLARQDISIDMSRVFGRIARNRLTGLELRTNGADLSFRTNCKCHAVVWEFRPNILIVDIVDGAPKDDSVFEARLASVTRFPAAGPSEPEPLGPRVALTDSGFTATAQLPYYWRDTLSSRPSPQTEPEPTDQRGESTHDPAGAKPEGVSGLAAANGNPASSELGIDVTRDYSAPAGEPDPKFDISHNDSGRPSEPEAAAEMSQDPAAEAERVASEPIDITRGFDASILGNRQPELAQTEHRLPNVDAVPPDVVVKADGQATIAGPTDAAALLEAPQAEPPSLVLPFIFPDRQPQVLPAPTLLLRPANPRIDAARDALLMELGRAATQGLVSVAQPKRPLMPSQLVSQPTAANPEPVASALTVTDPAQADDHMTIRAETSIDRDTIGRTGAEAVTENGRVCLPDSSFAVRDWGDDRPMYDQLAERRQALVGEFAVPPSYVVADLAKTYLYFGFGAEASDTLRAFGAPVADSDILQIMAQSVEYGFADSLGRLEGMATCDSAAALWATLATPRLPAGDPINVGAVVRSFSGLPIELRRLVGPVLSARFLEIGDERTARTLQDAVDRAAGDAGPQSRLIEARLELTLDKTAQAERIMNQLVAEDGPASPEALILLIDTQIFHHIKVTQPTMETAAALAFEHRGTELGSRLARAEVLSKAAYGNFDAAFATLALQTTSGPKAMPTELDQDLFSLLLLNGDDATFLRHMLGSLDRVTENELSRQLRQGLAERMATLGFPEAAERILAASAKPKPADRMVLARIALAKDDPSAALRQIESLEGSGADLIKAEALTRLGYHAQAAAAYAKADQPVKTASAGWLAGDISAIQKHGTSAQQAAINALSKLPTGQNAVEPAAGPALIGAGPPKAPAEPAGILARDRGLLQESRTLREQLTALMDAFPAPDISAAPAQP